jgi:hypothetical protein
MNIEGPYAYPILGVTKCKAPTQGCDGSQDSEPPVKAPRCTVPI